MEMASFGHSGKHISQLVHLLVMSNAIVILNRELKAANYSRQKLD